jgi:hypothetical protein
VSAQNKNMQAASRSHEIDKHIERQQERYNRDALRAVIMGKLHSLFRHYSVGTSSFLRKVNLHTSPYTLQLTT